MDNKKRLLTDEFYFLKTHRNYQMEWEEDRNFVSAIAALMVAIVE